MINQEMLASAIKNSGYKLNYIASQIGLTPAGLALKREGSSDFKAKEIQALKDLLQLSETETCEIFFSEEGDYRSPIDDDGD